MAPVRTQFVVKAAVVGDLSGEECVNTMFFITDDESPTQSTCERVARGVRSWWEARMLPILHQNYRLNYVEAQGLDAELTGYGRSNPVGTGLGQITTGLQAPNVCTIAVSFATGFTGRSARGRNFFPCLANAQITAVNEVSIGAATTILDAYAELGGDVALEAPDARHVVLSTQRNNAPRPAGFWLLVESYALTDLTIDAQRNRLPGRGI